MSRVPQVFPRWIAVAITALALGATTALVGAVSPAAALPSTLVVDDNLACSGAAFSTISSAVAAAAAGDTIKVCAGVYPELVTVDKPLRFLGAKAGQDGRKHRGKPNKESIVTSSSGEFQVQPDIGDVTVDGFTLQGAGGDSAQVGGFQAILGGSGFTIVDNVIRDNFFGVNLQNPDPTRSTEIARNAFISNNAVSGGFSVGGIGVSLSTGPTNNITIEDNAFSLHKRGAIDFDSSLGERSQGLVIADNSSKNDFRFARGSATINTLIDHNKITYSGDQNGDAITENNNNVGMRITNNLITGGYSPTTAGILLFGEEEESSGASLTGNTISGRARGIAILGPSHGVFVSDNTVAFSGGIGIYVRIGVTGNVLLNNTVRASAGPDCEDDTFGAGSSGTGNVWRHNSGDGGSSIPGGICPA